MGRLRFTPYISFSMPFGASLGTPNANEQTVSQDYSSKIAGNFVLISLVYLFIGITWMGPGSFLFPSPSGNAGAAFDTARWHLVFIGFIGFNIMGLLYYAAPKIGARPLHSVRLARIHFWLSNILLPITIVFEITAVTAYADTLNASANIDPSTFPTGLLISFVAIIALFFAAILSQVPFAYNMYRTIKG